MMDGQPDPGAQDWWTANAPPMPTGPVTDPNDPRLGNPQHANDPDVLAFINSIYGPQGTVYNKPAGSPGWDANAQAWEPAPPTPTPGPTGGGNPPPTPGSTALPGAPDNFGAVPPTYTPASYTAPTWQGGPPPSAPTLARYTLPTQAELEASPGFLSREAAANRGLNMSAAAKGSVLNGGTQKALARYNQDYASNEYNNLVGQGQSTVALNNNATQTEFGDAFSNYQARYGQFTDAAMMGKNAFDTNEGNRFGAFTTNTANKRNTETDYWTRLNDLYQTGANTANNSYRPGA